MRSTNVYLASLMNSVIRWAGKSVGRVVIYSSVARLESEMAILQPIISMSFRIDWDAKCDAGSRGFHGSWQIYVRRRRVWVLSRPAHRSVYFCDRKRAFHF
jgi:hypothetical protein